MPKISLNLYLKSNSLSCLNKNLFSPLQQMESPSLQLQKPKHDFHSPLALIPRVRSINSPAASSLKMSPESDHLSLHFSHSSAGPGHHQLFPAVASLLPTLTHSVHSQQSCWRGPSKMYICLCNIATQIHQRLTILHTGKPHNLSGPIFCPLLFLSRFPIHGPPVVPRT